MTLLTAIWQLLARNAPPQVWPQVWPPGAPPLRPMLALVSGHTVLDMTLADDRWVARPPAIWTWTK